MGGKLIVNPISLSKSCRKTRVKTFLPPPSNKNKVSREWRKFVELEEVLLKVNLRGEGKGESFSSQLITCWKEAFHVE
jgi:hypothetical protein